MNARTTAKIITRPCRECGEVFEVKAKAGAAQRYCSKAHRKAWDNRQVGRGAKIVTLAQAWRQGRHKKGSAAAKLAFTELCLALDRMSTEDRDAGRVGALDVMSGWYREQGILGGGK